MKHNRIIRNENREKRKNKLSNRPRISKVSAASIEVLPIRTFFNRDILAIWDAMACMATE